MSSFWVMNITGLALIIVMMAFLVSKYQQVGESNNQCQDKRTQYARGKMLAKGIYNML